MLDLSNKKCSFEEHKNIDAIDYCSECDIYICEKCKDYHRFLIENHHNKKLSNKEPKSPPKRNRKRRTNKILSL